jgi:hypothetical protein
MSQEQNPKGRSDWKGVVIAAIITAVVGAVATVTAAMISHQQGMNEGTVKYKTITKYKKWAPCPRSDKPMALIASDDTIPTPPKNSGGQLGVAHIDNVIAPDGSANVVKQEKVCITITKYPDRGRTLWLVLRLRLPVGHPTYQLFYAVGELSDPAPGRYSVSIDRSCTAMSSGSRHTLAVVSAPDQATKQLWTNYNDRIRNACRPVGDNDRHKLPLGTFRVSNQGDVIQDR